MRARKPNPRTLAVGDIVGPFKVLAFAGRKQRAENTTEWNYLCKCLKCGNEHERKQSQFKKTAQSCKACAGRHIANMRALNSPPPEALQDVEKAAFDALKKMGWKL